MGIRLFLGCLISTCIGSTPSLAYCTLYEHRDYGGASWALGDRERMIMIEGEDIGVSTGGHCPECEYTIYYEPSWNDALSSFTVDAGCTISLWEHINEGGARFRTYRSYSYIGDAWNDEVSEAWCVCE